MITRGGSGGGRRGRGWEGPRWRGLDRQAAVDRLVAEWSHGTHGTPHTRSGAPPHCAATHGEVTMLVVLRSCALLTE